jgi:hypothetical protein
MNLAQFGGASVASFFTRSFRTFCSARTQKRRKSSTTLNCQKGMPHEVAAGLADLECASFGVAGPGGFAPA